jgi:hypothetical protein
VPVATKSQSKTGFVKNFLQSNPKGNTKAVNQAWTAAGMRGTIGHTVVSEVRKRLGLIANQPRKTKAAVKPKPGARMAKTAGSPGKAMFVKEFLNDHPQSNVAAVNKAWQAAGFDGTIGKTVVFKVKSAMGLTGNLLPNAKKTKPSATNKKRATTRKVITAAVNVHSPRTDVLNELEADIDRLLFKVMGAGALPEIEDTLRRARRLLYGVSTRG